MNLKNLTKVIPYQWRVQSFQTNTAVCVAYIDSRDVQVTLDEEIGPENWQCDYKEIKGNLFCGLGIKVGENWVWKWDCGTESNTEKEKGEASDSFKRAAVKWGIGRFLYDLEILRIQWVEKNGKKYPSNEKGEPIYDGAKLTEFLNKRQKSVTSYNHSPIEKNGMPVITNIQFKKAIERVRAGELDVYYKTTAAFSLESKQAELFKQAYDEAKKQPA